MTLSEYFTPGRRFTVLLVTLVFLLFGQVFLTARVEGVLGPVLFTLVLLSALGAISGSRRRKAIAATLAIPACLLLVADSQLSAPAIAVAASAVAIVFLGYAAVAILDYVFRADHVDASVIQASLCVYILLTVMWGEAYGLMELLRPGSLKLPSADAVAETRGMLQYFSFVTITTVGYGDIYPVSPLARATAATEALLGQLYLVVLVARLVGLHTAQEARERH